MWCNQDNLLNSIFPGAGEPSQRDPPAINAFCPYSNNGGSIVAIAGADYAIIGADTRLSTGFSIYTREQRKLVPLSEWTVLGATGCWCDTLTLTKLLQTHMKMYRLDNGRNMSTPAAAQMLSTMLYYKRFFPYYVLNILAGLDSEGKGCVYSFDPLGHCDKARYHAVGSAGAQLQPLLDNQISQDNVQNAVSVPLPSWKAMSLMKDVFVGAAERDIFTGDSIYLMVITADGIKEEKFDLRKD